MDWITHIITFFVGLGAGWSIRVIYSSRKNITKKSSSENVKFTQTGNKVTSGSIVGRDQNSSHH